MLYGKPEDSNTILTGMVRSVSCSGDSISEIVSARLDLEYSSNPESIATSLLLCGSCRFTGGVPVMLKHVVSFWP